MASMSFALTRLSGLTAKTSLSADFDTTSRRHILPLTRVGLKTSSSSAATDSEPDLSVTVNGLKMPNPFVIIAKTILAKVINVTPRYAWLRAGSNGSAKTDVIGWQNIELISSKPCSKSLSN